MAHAERVIKTTSVLILLFAVDLSATAQYDLTVRVGAAERRMQVSGRMTFTTDADAPSISLVLSQRMSSVRFTLVEPRGFSIRDVRSQPKGRNLAWTLATDKVIPAGAKVTLTFQYDGAGEIESQYHIGPEVTFVSAWGTDWYPLITAEDDKGIGRLSVHVPPAHDALAIGQRVGDERVGGERVITYDIRHPTYFAFAAGIFHVHLRGGKTPSKLYLLKDRPSAEKWLEGAAAIVAALEKEFGAYPQPELIFVEIPRHLSDAASFNAAGLPGLILLNHRVFDVPDMSYLWEFLTHEIAHAWFPHYFSIDRPGGRYMEEALAEYGALATVETLGGPDLARQLRISGYPTDPIFSAAKYFENVDRGNDHPIGALQPMPEHRQLAYTKGFLFFHMLARKVGVERFRTALAEIVRGHPHQSLPWWTFLAEIEKRTGSDLATFYDQWLNRTGAPSWTSSWRNVAGGTELTLRQSAPTYVLDLPVRVTLEGGKTIETVVHLDAAEATIVIAAPAPAASVEVDPDFHILHRLAPPATTPPK